MFTRYKGTSVPENYSGVLFRDAYAPPTEMKTHKPSPSYTSTKTSVSPTFRSAQLQRNLENSGDKRLQGVSDEESGWRSDEKTGWHSDEKMDWHSNLEDGDGDKKEIREQEDAFYRNDLENFTEYESIHGENEVNSSNDGDFDARIVNEQESDTRKKAPTQSFGAELNEVFERILRSIQSEDFLLLAVIFLLLGDEKSKAKETIFPLALLLLYS